MMASPKRRCMPSLSHLLHITLGKARCCHATLEPCMENCSSTVLACHFKPNPLVSSGSDLSATHNPTIFLHQFHPPTQGCTSICLSGSRSTRTDLYCDGAVAILLKPLLLNRYITEKYQSSLLLHDSSFMIDILPHLHRSAAKYNRHAICFVFVATLQASRSHLLQWQFTLRAQPYKQRNFLSR